MDAVSSLVIPMPDEAFLDGQRCRSQGKDNDPKQYTNDILVATQWTNGWLFEQTRNPEKRIELGLDP